MKIIEDKKTADALALTAFVVVESLHFLVVLGLVYSFVPLPLADFIKDLPMKLQKTIKPKREMFFYHWFLFFAMTLQVGCVSFFRWRRMDIPRRALLRMACVDVLLLAVELFAVFKIWQYDSPWWAKDLLYAGIGAWVLSKVFWVECQQGFKLISEVMMEKRKILTWCLDAIVPVLLIVCLWVPDVQKVLGRAFVWDQFRNWDTSMMLPGWGYVQGEGLNTDIISSWGMGAVIIISRSAQALGAFDYARVLTVLMVMVILYYTALYFFLRAWLRSALLAAAVVAVAIKLQLFHTGISPLIWIFPQDTPVRHWLDIPVLWCLWQHARSSKGKYLLWAGCGIGASLAWALSTGLSLLAGFWGYLIFLMMVPEYRPLLVSDYRSIRRTCAYIGLPLVMMTVMLFLLQGSAVWHPVFWKNMFEPFGLFMQGKGTLSFYACLYDRHFFAFIVSFIIPVIYAWTLITVAGLAASKKSPREDLFLVPLCVYGLVLYMHYLAHSSISHYYAVGVPAVMVLGFWTGKIMSRLAQGRRWKVLVLLAAGAWGALFTNVFFVYYPNIFDMARMDWGPEVNFYRTQSGFDQDAAMVRRLTAPHQTAAVIGGFEARLLMQADRRPFFYDTPLVASQPMNANTFAGTSVITQERLERTISRISTASPEYIFVEKRLLGQWPAEYVQHYPGIVLVLRYVVDHYSTQEEGQYFIAMHRK